jgi:hypothetical protein
MTLNKYAAGLLTLVGTLMYAMQLAMADNIFTPKEAWELGGLAAGSAVAIFVPLVPGVWAAVLKVGGNVIVAVAGAVVGVIVSGTWDAATWTALIFVGVNALLTQLGVWIRTDAAKEALAAPAVPNTVPQAVDPQAVKVVQVQAKEAVG